jgi:hypothetical protein
MPLLKLSVIDMTKCYRDMSDEELIGLLRGHAEFERNANQGIHDRSLIPEISYHLFFDIIADRFEYLSQLMGPNLYSNRCSICRDYDGWAWELDDGKRLVLFEIGGIYPWMTEDIPNEPLASYLEREAGPGRWVKVSVVKVDE